MNSAILLLITTYALTHTHSVKRSQCSNECGDMITDTPHPTPTPLLTHLCLIANGYSYCSSYTGCSRVIGPRAFRAAAGSHRRRQGRWQVRTPHAHLFLSPSCAFSLLILVVAVVSSCLLFLLLLVIVVVASFLLFLLRNLFLSFLFFSLGIALKLTYEQFLRANAAAELVACGGAVHQRAAAAADARQ